MPGLRPLIARYLRAYNGRDFGAWADLFDEHAVVHNDAGVLRGRAAIRAFAEGTLRAFPGLRAELERIVAETGDRIVAEYRMVNPRENGSGWRLHGLVCDIYDVRDGLIAACHSYYLPDREDQTDVGPVPSRAEAARLGDEQAALRRVATLVAQGAERRELFAAVNESIARLVGAEHTSMLRFEADDTATLVAVQGTEELPVGTRQPLDAALREMRDTGRPFRYGPAALPAAGTFVEEARTLGVRSVVGVPIVVDGRVWGASFASSAGAEPLREDAEQRIAAFCELVATSIANAQARSELQSLAAEQEALRRVATLVARGAAQPELFAAVTEEASRLLGEQPMVLQRYDRDGGVTAVAVHQLGDLVGTRVPPDPESVAGRVRETRRPARVDAYGRQSGPAAEVAGRVGVQASVGAPIVVAGEVWGLLLVMSFDRPLPAQTEDRLSQFAELVATAIANAEGRSELTASRARVVAAADETRRRIQRDLHDGAQQRLVHTVLRLKLARSALPADGMARELVEEALQLAEQATTELGELVQGIMPAALANGGLRAGVESLISHVALPVQADVTRSRFPAPVEATAYFIIAEALTNTLKHAGASSVTVRATDGDGELRLEVRDDGAGGADPALGSGLVGLADRVAAAGGTIALESPPGEGTAVLVTLPV